MKPLKLHIKYAHLICFLIIALFGTWDVKGQTSSNPNGFENNSLGDWAGGTATETVALNSVTVRTGTKSIALTTTSTSTNRYWLAHSPYGASATGTYVHYIYWARVTAGTPSVDASMRYTAFAPPTGAGTTANATTAYALSAASWTQVRFNAGNNNNRWYFPAPRRTTGIATTFYMDDIIIYTSTSNTTDIVGSGSPTAASGNDLDGLVWTNGTDAGVGATGVQATLLFKRTGGTNGSNDLTLNNQAIYSLVSTEGPSVVGNWTLVTNSIAPSATSYSTGPFVNNQEYAIVHRDLAYNYSAPTYAVLSHNGKPVVTTQATSSITTTSATGNGTITDVRDGVTTSGICWNTGGNPTTADSKTTNGPTTAIAYTGNISGLTPNTLYYVKAYATGSGGTGYGTQTSFTSLPNAPTIGSGSNIGGGSFTANWAAPVGQGSEVFTYTVQVTTISGDYSSPVVEVNGISSGSLSELISGLNGETEYFYRVRATNVGGNSAWTSQSLGVTTLQQRTLTVTVSPGASGTVTGNAIPLTSGVATAFGLNENVTLLATPASGYGFLRWIIGGTTRNTDNPYDITMANNTAVTAQFAASTCTSYTFEGLTATDISTTADVNDDFITNGGEWSVLVSRLNTSATYSHAGSNSIRLAYNNGSLITPIAARPVSISYWARMYSTAYASTVKVYLSTDGGASYNPTPIYTHAVSGASWVQFSTPISTSSGNVRIKIENASGQASTNYNMVIDDVQVCVGPELIPPSLIFVPTNQSSNVSISNDLSITSNEKLYRYVPTTGALIALTVGDPAFSNPDTLATILTLKKVSDNSDVPFTVTIDATGKILTVNPSSNLSYATAYRLSIRNVADVNGNILASTQYSEFTTQTQPAPIISIKEVPTKTSYATGSTVNMGTVFGGTSISKTFRIYNTGNASLTITSSNFTTGVKYAKTLSPAASVNAGDSTSFTVEFTPGATLGIFTDIITIVNNDATKPNYILNFTGGKAQFVLPYKYQSGCTAPVMSPTELTHDYTMFSDIPSEVTLKNGVALDSMHFFNSYKVFQSEGNCMPFGNSALRVGEGVNALQIVLPNCGEVKLRWCSNGYRKVKISDALGNTYEQSPSYLPGFICYSTNTIVNTPNPITIYIEFMGIDSTLLTTLYYLEITPYSVAYQSSGRNILEFSTGVVGEVVHIYNDVILATVPAGTNLSTITPSHILPSPFASVNPGEGVTKDFTTPVVYTVTAQNGLTKNYTVSVEHEVVYSAPAYSDSIVITVDMNETDKKLEVVEIANSTCKVPIAGNGSNYTINFLSEEDLPVEGYTIDGLRQLCIGSTATYSISNAPTTNFPRYTWHLTGPDKDLFTIIGDTVSETLTLRAPDELVRTVLNFSVLVEFEPCNCLFLRGEDTLAVNIIFQDPDPIDGLTANCVVNGLLTVSALGSNNATAYNWDFTPSIPIVSQDANTIVLNIGNNTNDISATVNTQNGCGITFDPTAWDIPYAMPETKWTGALDNDWDKNANWTARVPRACTNVIIPDVGGIVEYPVIGASGECHYITFEPGGAVLNLHKLDYVRAYVQLETQRDIWYTLTAPLKEMYSGDYYFNGSPEAYMKMFDAPSPDAIGPNINYVGNFTRSFKNLHVPLVPGDNFGFKVSQKTWNYPNGFTNVATNKIVTFPRMNLDSSLVTSYIPYSAYNGMPYPFITETVTKDASLAYRFAMENANNVLPSIIKAPVKVGLNYVGNPMMAHLDFNLLYASNVGVISNKVKFWNGTTFTTFMSGSQIHSSLDLSSTSVPPMQAFFIEGLVNDSMLIDLDTHYVIDLTTKLRSAGTSSNLLHIKASNATKHSYTAIALRPNTNNDYGDDDAFKMFTQYTEVPEVYTVAEEMALDINQFSSLPYSAPIGLKTSIQGPVTFAFYGAESFENVDVMLINTKTGEQQNLKANNEYVLNYDGTNTDGYMFVEFRNAQTPTGNTETVACSKCIQVYQKDSKTIGIISPENDKIDNITVWEPSGKMLYSKFEINSTLHDVVVAPRQSCIVRVATKSSTYVVKLLMK